MGKSQPRPWKDTTMLDGLKTLAAGAALTATLAMASPASAAVVFDQTAAGAYSFVVDTTGLYDIAAFGAQGA